VDELEGLDGLVLKRISTAQQVADGLSEMILSGRMPPGTHLKESAIATSLGISRNTVREAVRILEQGSLVVRPEMHRGASVVEPSDEELADIYQARLSLEVAAAGVINSPESVAAVREAFDALVEASELRQLEIIVERDLGFHAAIVSQFNSKRLDVFYDQLARQLRFFLMVLSVEDREYEEPEQVIYEHGQIVQAMEEGNTARAQQLITDLIKANEQRVRSIFRERVRLKSLLR
jgi:DNA-binding GntR family transcriptional regulator